MEQTAIQEMIDIIQMDMNNGVEISMNVFMGMLKKAKEKEKIQIIRARQSGIDATINGKSISNIDYYNETFKSK